MVFEAMGFFYYIPWLCIYLCSSILLRYISIGNIKLSNSCKYCVSSLGDLYDFQNKRTRKEKKERKNQTGQEQNKENREEGIQERSLFLLLLLSRRIRPWFRITQTERQRRP